MKDLIQPQINYWEDIWYKEGELSPVDMAYLRTLYRILSYDEGKEPHKLYKIPEKIRGTKESREKFKQMMRTDE